MLSTATFPDSRTDMAVPTDAPTLAEAPARRPGATEATEHEPKSSWASLSPLAFQVAAVEAAGLVVLVAWPVAWLRWVALALLAVVASLVLGRRRERWWFEWALVGLRHRRRVAAGAGTDREVSSYVDRSGTRFGFLATGSQLTAVVAIEPLDAGTVTAGDSGSMPIGRVVDALVQRDVTVASVQVVSHAVPAPTPRVDPRGPVASSYREVCAGQSVAARTVWVAVRLDPARCPAAVLARGSGLVGAQRCLAAVTARLVAALAPVARGRVLGPDEVRAAVALVENAEGAELVEGWREVQGSGIVRVAYRLDGPVPVDGAALFEVLATVPSLATVLSVTLTPDADELSRARVVLRTDARTADAAGVAEAVTRAAQARGVRLVRLDGEHGLGIAETLPTGGASWGPSPADRVALPVARVDPVSVPLSRGGLWVGRDASGGPVVAHLFRERPTVVSAIMAPPVALVLCYRALAVGSAVEVVTSRPHVWMPLRRLGVDDADVVRILGPGSVDEPVSAHPARPVFVLVDAVDPSTVPHVPARPWQCVMTVFASLSAAALPVVRGANAVLLQRPADVESTAAMSALHAGLATADLAGSLTDEQVCVVERGRAMVADLGVTAFESRLVVAASGSASVVA
jgi:type VII secretion protein EccE